MPIHTMIPSKVTSEKFLHFTDIKLCVCINWSYFNNCFHVLHKLMINLMSSDCKKWLVIFFVSPETRHKVVFGLHN